MGTACNMRTAAGGTPRVNTADVVPTYPGPLPGGVHPISPSRSAGSPRTLSSQPSWISNFRRAGPWRSLGEWRSPPSAPSTTRSCRRSSRSTLPRSPVNANSTPNSADRPTRSLSRASPTPRPRSRESRNRERAPPSHPSATHSSRHRSTTSPLLPVRRDMHGRRLVDNNGVFEFTGTRSRSRRLLDGSGASAGLSDRVGRVRPAVQGAPRCPAGRVGDGKLGSALRRYRRHGADG
jgi:hypothetical protein